MRISRRLIVVWVFLAGAAALPWFVSGPPPNPTDEAPIIAEAPTPPANEVPALAEMTETTSRPLFSASRRPPPPETATAERQPAPKPSRLVGYRLTGIVRSSSRRMILLTEEKSGRVVELHEGDEVDGWRLTSIEGDHARLTRDGLEIALPDRNTVSPEANGLNTRWLPSGGERR